MKTRGPDFTPAIRRRQRQDTRTRRAWLAVGAVWLAAAGVVGSVAGADAYSHRRGVRLAIAPLEAEVATATAEVAAMQAELAGLRARERAVRSVRDRADWSVPVRYLTSAVQGRAWLDELSLTGAQGAGRLTLVMRGSGEEQLAVLELCSQLQATGVFEDVRPVRSEENGGRVRFEVRGELVPPARVVSATAEGGDS
ncbi:MAG: hypothetical protein AAF747_11425 [Planctomycetota bacterium]